MKRKYNDSAKAGVGIDEARDEKFTNVPEDNIDSNFRGEDDSYSPAYKSDGDKWTSEKSAAIDWQRFEDRQFTYGTRDIFSDVITNSNLAGGSDFGMDYTDSGGRPGPIKAGVSRSQTDGEKRRGGR